MQTDNLLTVDYRLVDNQQIVNYTLVAYLLIVKQSNL